MQERHPKFVNAFFLPLVVIVVLLHTGAADITIKFTLFVEDLMDFDFWSAPDPFVKLYFAKDDGEKYKLLGRTKSVTGYNAKWPDEFSATIHEKRYPNDEEYNEKLRVDLIDEDGVGENDFIGAVSVRVRTLIPKQNRKGKYLATRKGPGDFCFHVHSITTEKEGYQAADEKFWFPVVVGGVEPIDANLTR